MRKKKPSKTPTTREDRRIKDFLQELEFLFDYQNWDRSICYCDADRDDCAAEVKSDPAYRRITIHLYPSFFRHTRKEQRELLLHEFCHTFTDGLYKASVDLLNGKLTHWDGLKSLNEEATSRITNTLHGLLIGRKRYAKVAYDKYLK